MRSVNFQLLRFNAILYDVGVSDKLLLVDRSVQNNVPQLTLAVEMIECIKYILYNKSASIIECPDYCLKYRSDK